MNIIFLVVCKDKLYPLDTLESIQICVARRFGLSTISVPVTSDNHECLEWCLLHAIYRACETETENNYFTKAQIKQDRILFSVCVCVWGGGGGS